MRGRGGGGGGGGCYYKVTPSKIARLQHYIYAPRPTEFTIAFAKGMADIGFWPVKIQPLLQILGFNRPPFLNTAPLKTGELKFGVCIRGGCGFGLLVYGLWVSGLHLLFNMSSVLPGPSAAATSSCLARATSSALVNL